MQSTMFKYLLFLIVVGGNLFSQESLTLEAALKLAVEKNYSVLMLKNQQQIAALQNNIGAAGMSPTISLEGRVNSSKLNSFQVFTNGTEQDRIGAKATGVGASLNADWLIFDGLRMFAVRKRLSMSENISTLQLRQQIENTTYEVIASYYNVVRINELIKAAKQNLLIYEERRKIAEVRREIGSDSKVEVLLSKSDENKAKSEIILLELDLLNAKTNLNTLLGRPVDISFEASDSILVNYEPAYDDLKKTSRIGNTSVLMSKQNELITEQNVREAKSLNLPQITFNGAYVFTRNQSEAGFLLSNRQNGLNLGLTGRWLIFNGGRNNRTVKEMDIISLNQRYFTEQTQLQVDAVVFINYQAFLLHKKIVEMELQNLVDSKEVLEISLERYRVGKANLLETIETQKNLEDAQARYINALYNIKLSEANLLRVNGTLVK